MNVGSLVSFVFGNRKKRFLFMLVSTLALSGVLGGVAHAYQGDKDGSKTGTDVSHIVPADKAEAQNNQPSLTDVAGQTEKNRVSINMDWLMLGGILVLFMQAGFALVETGFTR